MPDAESAAYPGFAEPESTAPSAFQRVLLTFTSPARAFERLGNGRSAWLPYLLMVLVSFGFIASIGSRVGWDVVARNNLAASPKQQARLDQQTPAQQEQTVATVARITRVIAFASPIVWPLVGGGIITGILFATFKFAMNADVHFGPLYAVYLFSALPQMLKGLLGIAMLLLGGGGESFQIGNPLGSNPAFYLQGSSVPHALLAALSWIDVFLVWQLFVLIVGCSVVARVSRGKAARVVLGWTALCILASTVGAIFG